MRRITVVMNGKARETRVYDADTGEEIKNLSAIRIEQHANQPPIAHLTEVAVVVAGQMEATVAE